jgi:Flp pilus assembly protein CpaB
MVLALLALGACVAAMVAVSVWDRRSTMRPAPASGQRRHSNDA